jgi:2'-5' RNA ligase
VTAPPSCFAALPVPPTPAIAAVQAALPPPLRRVHPQDLHVTVAYFGRVDPALHPALLEAIAAASFAGAPAVLDRVIALPDRARASSLVWTLAPGPGRDAVVALMAAWRDPLRAVAALPPEGRDPLPHVTFARPRGRRRPPPELDSILRWADAQPPLGVSVALPPPVLMRSLPPNGPGPHYEVVGGATRPRRS